MRIAVKLYAIPNPSVSAGIVIFEFCEALIRSWTAAISVALELFDVNSQTSV